MVNLDSWYRESTGFTNESNTLACLNFGNFLKVHVGQKYKIPKILDSEIQAIQFRRSNVFLGDIDIGDMFEMLVTDFHSQYEIGPISRKS